MKLYPRIEMDAGGNHDFPRLARESDLLDIDRLIRERDLESLQSVFTSIASCSLTNEYDVKVLDPNFVKLFRLAQLSVDYLQYCRNYLDHCVIVLQEQLQVALHEIEQLQQERQMKEDQIKQLAKKLKEKAKASGNNGLSAIAADYGNGIPGISSGISQSSFRCIPCGKMFVSAIFLQRHFVRRHPEQLQLNNEAEKLRLEVHQLEERLQKAEDLLKRANSQVETKQEALSENIADTVDKETKPGKVDKAQNTDEDVTQMKTPAGGDTPKRSQQSEEDIRALMENFKRQSEEIEALRNQLKSQHFAQESVWQKRLEQLELRHHSDIDALRTSLSQPNSLTTQPPGNSFNLKELYEKQIQISRPGMVGKGTQVESIPERPQPLQEAFTKPTPDHYKSTSPKQNPANFSRSDPVRTDSIESHALPEKRPSSMQSAIRHNPQTTEQNHSSISGSQQFSKMSGDFSTTESSSEESVEAKNDESEAGESSTSTEDKIKDLSSLANKPQVLAPLRNDIEEVMSRSLRELGIDPEWKGIPNATYQSITATLQHQRGILQKGRRDLVKLREDLSREVDDKARKALPSASSQKETVPIRKIPARPPPPRSLRSNKQENEYTAEPRRERPVKPTVVYEEVKNKDDNVVTVQNKQEAPVPPSRRRSVEKPPISQEKTSVPVPSPRVTPTTAELLADMEKLRQQGTLLKSEVMAMTKSNLKSSSSSGNIAKKRVVFLDEKDDFPTVELGLNDSEFGMFQTRNPTNANSSFLGQAQRFSANNVSRDVTSKFDIFSANGSGEPVRREGETNVVRMAREIEEQLLSKPKPPNSQFSSSFDHRSSQLDLILDDLSSS